MLRYLLENQIGSTSLTTDASGQIISELPYKAWGEMRYASGNTPTRYQYTGQYSYSGEFGLLFYNARWYDSSLGRFAQADTIIPGVGNPQAWDRYSYVTNNPLRYTDPTGHRPCGDGEAVDCDGYSYTPPPPNVGCGVPGKPSCGGGGGNSDDGNNGGGSQPELSPDLQSPGAGTCGTGYSPHCPGWHFYTTTHLVCPAEFLCSPEEMLDQFHRYVYPGQDPSQLIISGQSYSVSLCYKDLCLPMGQYGAIVVAVKDGGFTTVNTTLSTHILYDGEVTRHLYQDDAGDWYVSSYGYGNNTTVDVVTPGPPPGLNPPNTVPASLASLNNFAGPHIFYNADQQMLMNIINHHR